MSARITKIEGPPSGTRKPCAGEGTGVSESVLLKGQHQDTTQKLKAEAPRTIDDLNKLLPFSYLCELWYPRGEWIGVSYVRRDFAADTKKKTWGDLKTGDDGVGSISLAAHVFSVSDEEAERRMSIWASSMLTVHSDGSIEIGGER
jgi:hypothetical protein